MDPYTEQLLERTRQRREMLNQKMGKTPEVTPRKRFLQENTSENVTHSNTTTLVKEASPGKRQCVREDEMQVHPDTPAISSVKSRLHKISQQRSGWTSEEGTDSEPVQPKPVPRQSIQSSSSPEEVIPPKVEGSRRDRLANLAATINNWEDDLSHPSIPSSKNTEEKKPKWQPPKKEEVNPIQKSNVDTDRWQSQKKEEVSCKSPVKKLNQELPPAPACPSPKKYAAPPPPTGSPLKSKSSIVLMQPQSSEVKPKHQIKQLVDKEPVNAATPSWSKTGTTAGTPCKPVVSKVEQPVKQMATPVSDKPPRPSPPSTEPIKSEPDSEDPASKPVSSRMASWQQRVNSNLPVKEEEPTAYSVNARMSAWETMTSANQVSNIKKVDPGNSPTKSSPCRQGPIQATISKARTVTPSKIVKESIMEKASKIQSSITTPVANQTPSKLQPGQSPAKIGSATKMIHQKLFDQAQHSKADDMADQIRQQRMAELQTLQNRWHNGVLKEDKPKVNMESSQAKSVKEDKKEAVREKARADFDGKLAAMGFDLQGDQASYDFKKEQQDSESELPEKKPSPKIEADVEKPPPAPPLPQQSLPPRPPTHPAYKTNNKTQAKPGTSLYRLISQKRNDKPDVPLSQQSNENSSKKVQFEDSFDSTEDEELYLKKSSSSNEEEMDIGEEHDTSTDESNRHEDSYESSTSAFSTDIDHPSHQELPAHNTHVIEDDTDGDDCSLSAFVPASVRRESILPQGPSHEATPEKSGGQGKRTTHPVASVPSAYRHQSTTNLRAFVQEDTSSSQASSSSSLNSDVSSGQSSINDDDDETNEAEIDDFLDEAMSDTESESKPPVITPRKRRSHMIATSGSYESHGDEHNLVYSVSMYRHNRDGDPKSPDRKIVRNRQFQESIQEEEIEMPTSLPPDVERKSVHERIQELQELVSQEQSVIMQTSNALNQCCLGNSHFAGSAEQVECNRLLLLACQRRQAYLTEIQRLKETGQLDPPGHGTKGSLTISDIRLPLKKEFVTKIGTTQDNVVHYFLILIRNNAQIITTQMLSTHDPMMRGSLDFPNLIKIHGISGSFKLIMEIYSMNVSRELSLKDKKKKTPKKSSMKNTHITMPSPGGPTAVRTTSFTLITTLPISMKSLDKTSFTLERISYLSPLHGTIYMRLKCLMEQNVEERGFLTMFEDVSGLGAWHRRWCVLAGNKLCFWKYPDDEQKKDPIGYFDLKRCITEKVGLIPRDICARPNTFEMVTVRQPRRGEHDTLITKTYNTMTTTRHMLSADTKEERINWCNKINRALANIRTWHSDAMRPVRLPNTTDT